MSSKRSKLEELFLFQARAYKLEQPEAEYRFHDTRQWRFDYAWIDLKLAIEIQGMVWGGKGRHQNPKALETEYEKLNEAARLGWVVLKFTGNQVRTGYAIHYLVEHFPQLKN